QLVELSDFIQSISCTSTYSESNETLQEFVTSLRLNATDQVYDLEVKTPISTNMNDTIVASASSS
ncbi:3131_t:CDS:2, partial [Ambispora leptoticha]